MKNKFYLDDNGSTYVQVYDGYIILSQYSAVLGESQGLDNVILSRTQWEQLFKEMNKRWS